MHKSILPKVWLSVKSLVLSVATLIVSSCRCARIVGAAGEYGRGAVGVSNVAGDMSDGARRLVQKSIEYHGNGLLKTLKYTFYPCK